MTACSDFEIRQKIKWIFLRENKEYLEDYKLWKIFFPKIVYKDLNELNYLFRVPFNRRVQNTNLQESNLVEPSDSLNSPIPKDENNDPEFRKPFNCREQNSDLGEFDLYQSFNSLKVSVPKKETGENENVKFKDYYVSLGFTQASDFLKFRSLIDSEFKMNYHVRSMLDPNFIKLEDFNLSLNEDSDKFYKQKEANEEVYLFLEDACPKAVKYEIVEEDIFKPSKRVIKRISLFEEQSYAHYTEKIKELKIQQDINFFLNHLETDNSTISIDINYFLKDEILVAELQKARSKLLAYFQNRQKDLKPNFFQCVDKKVNFKSYLQNYHAYVFGKKNGYDKDNENKIFQQYFEIFFSDKNLGGNYKPSASYSNSNKIQNKYKETFKRWYKSGEEDIGKIALIIRIPY